MRERGSMKVEVVLAWPRRFQAVMLELAEGATVADALARSGLQPGSEVVAHALHGVRVEATQPLRDGDRVELLRPLQADPKEARRRRAAAR
jgi:putative ubiquitin-RnfH superfamily antitoxin RatB of RatAB toxin-antitoxin module